MKYAEVSVNSPAARRRTFSYAVPPGLDIRPGQAVLVPFGEKELQGVVMELTDVPAVEDTREIIGVIDPEPVLSPARISLARWLSEYYLAPLFSSVALMLPPGFERQAVAFIAPPRPDIDAGGLDAVQKAVFDIAVAKGRAEVKQAEKALGKKKAAAAIAHLVRQGLLEKTYELAHVRIKPRTELFISLNAGVPADVKLTSKQAALLAYLREVGRPVPWAEARRQTGGTKAAAAALVKQGLAAVETVEVKRGPVPREQLSLAYPLTLTPDQQAAFEAIKPEIGNENPSRRVFLLRGVTASGKTEIYLRLLAEAVQRGKKGIVLVPEISLTPQTIERFAARFPGRVGVLHSRLSLGGQYDEWRHIKKGGYDVVIGSRSAVFAPQPDLGLIIIDEEHEWTYKQNNSPHYHARDIAVKLSALTGAVVVLGSATPDVESYFKARNGEYRLLELPERVVPAAGASLPRVDVVDMREELKAGNQSIFSRSLAGAINAAMAAGGQVILFLNRRGGAYYIQCRRCGYVLRCRRCEVPLSHDIAAGVLSCHQCNYRVPVPEACPDCGAGRLKFLGTGTQKLEQEVKAAFPHARQLRWDSDAASGRRSDDEILEKFISRQADILIGTQLIAKGLDIPGVTLVGVVSADTALNLPDFRAGERTFQLLSQVAGRAGRGPLGGRVIIQTYSPDNYAIRAAAAHDYLSFYETEIDYRRRLRQPPFARLARLSFSHTNDAVCRREAEKMKLVLAGLLAEKGVAGIDIIGPAPAFIHRLRGRYRWQLVLRGPELSAFLAPVDLPRGWMIDIDPVGLIQ